MMNKPFSFLVLFLIHLHIALPQQSYFLTTTSHGKNWQMYGAGVCGNYLYIAGGNMPDFGYIRRVEKARINPDGSLGAWEETASLPHNRCYIDNSTIVLNDIIYIVGGYDGVGDKKYSSILWAKPGAEGHLEKWNESVPYTGEPVNCAVAFATPGFIYLAGGRTDFPKPTVNVWRATVKDDGEISGWDKGPPLPEPLWYHSGGVAGGRAWIWGGLTTLERTLINNKVFWAPILGSGEIGEWSVSEVSLPQGLFSSPSTVSGSYLISFCPRYSGAVISGDAWYAQANPEGLTGWVKASLNIPASLYIGLATDYRRGTVYIPGGRVSREQIFDSKTYYLKLYGFKQMDSSSITTPDFYIASEDPASTDKNLSYMLQTAETKGAFPGFLPYAQARQSSTSQKKPMVLYAHSQRALEVKSQNELLANFNAAKWGERVIFGEFDISQFPQNAQQLGIFKVPCWTFFDRSAQIKRQEYSLLKLSELEAYVEEILR
ncbi:hypothetical protein JW926_02940 [Candidatus Sumerlaeota bacterium]|nr:hypothetical protein [Candidatus Sumerlaeota bacterium]